VNSARAAQLLDLNRRFYLEHGADFADTRARVQPGVRRVLRSLPPEAGILDLGCGNGSFAAALSREGHRGPYLGVDFSSVMLERARSVHYDFPVGFEEVDLTSLAALTALVETESDRTWRPPAAAPNQSWNVVTMFAVLHHIPEYSLRLGLVKQVRRWLQGGARLILSNWQFSASSRMRARIVPWSAAGLSVEDVDEGDHLIDWRRGGPGLRYVHEFDETELARLAEDSGFGVVESFLSDGADGRSGLYQTWQTA
jgi:tRNA (uracil-5-)-methyltransferase TRM9